MKFWLLIIIMQIIILVKLFFIQSHLNEIDIMLQLLSLTDVSLNARINHMIYYCIQE
jgi:hypothetical protein